MHCLVHCAFNVIIKYVYVYVHTHTHTHTHNHTHTPPAGRKDPEQPLPMLRSRLPVCRLRRTLSRGGGLLCGDGGDGGGGGGGGVRVCVCVCVCVCAHECMYVCVYMQ